MAKHQRVKDIVTVFAIWTVVIILWELLVPFAGISHLTLPTPSQINAVFMTFAGEIFFKHLIHTMSESVLGFLLSVAVGVGLAVSIIYVRLLRVTLVPAIMLFNAFPKVAIAPLLVIWFGLGFNSKLIMAFLLAFFPILINATRGLSDIEPDLIDLTRLMKASEWKTFIRIRLPHSMPALFDAFKISVPLAVIGAIIGEFVGGNLGLGYFMLVAEGSLNTELSFAILGAIAVIALGLYGVVIALERRLLKWRPAMRSR